MWSLLLLLTLPTVTAWVNAPHSILQRPPSRLSLYEDEDAAYSAKPLPLSDSDRQRLAALRDRYKTIPIMILDAMLPGQRLEFGSNDPKFRVLVDDLLKASSFDKNVMGMIGLNPHTGKPLNIGVTASLETIQRNGLEYSIIVKGEECLEVQGEPWLDETESYYVAEVELVDTQKERPLDKEQQTHADRMFNDIPNLVDTWFQCLYASGRATQESMEPRLADIGPMPKRSIRDRALWTAALVNPLPALGVCFEVRPAMLACKNDYDRINLAWAALHSSIDHLSGKRPMS